MQNMSMLYYKRLFLFFISCGGKIKVFNSFDLKKINIFAGLWKQSIMLLLIRISSSKSNLSEFTKDDGASRCLFCNAGRLSVF